MVRSVDKGIYVVSSILILLFVAIVVSFVKELIERKKAYKALADEPQEEVPPVTAVATVLSKRTDICYGGGIKIPTHSIAFYVTFLVDGNVKEFEVTEEEYNEITENKRDVLVTVNGKFFAFGEAKQI